MAAPRVYLLLIAAAAACCVAVATRQPLLAQGGSAQLLSQLVWFDRSGAPLGTLGPVASHGNIELSPDGRHAAVAVIDPARGARDLWIYGVEDDTRRRFTETPADENWAVWSRDGQQLIFNSTRNGALDLFIAPAADGATPELLLQGGMWPVSVAPDGRHLLFVVNDPRTGNDVYALPLFGDRRPFPFARTPGRPIQENWAAFSPDGRWVAYSSDESGQSEVYVAAFPPTPEGMAARQRISPNGGSQARWNRNGREILYIGQDRSLMVSTVDAEGNAFEVERMARLFEPRLFFVDSHGFDLSPDGERLLINTVYARPDAPASIARR